jgi:bisphosphoglycerate-dependent phosphoglycerate mutase
MQTATVSVSLTLAIQKLADALDHLQIAKQQRPYGALKALAVAETAIHRASSRIALVRRNDANRPPNL